MKPKASIKSTFFSTGFAIACVMCTFYSTAAEFDTKPDLVKAKPTVEINKHNPPGDKTGISSPSTRVEHNPPGYKTIIDADSRTVVPMETTFPLQHPIGVSR